MVKLLVGWIAANMIVAEAVSWLCTKMSYGAVIRHYCIGEDTYAAWIENAPAFTCGVMALAYIWAMFTAILQIPVVWLVDEVTDIDVTSLLDR